VNREGLSELLDGVIRVASGLSPEAVLALADDVGRLSSSEDTRRLLSEGPTAAQRALVAQLLSAWKAAPEVTPDSLRLALMSAQRAVDTAAQAQSVELIWTGPVSGAAHLRRTDQALFDVIGGARRSLTIATFAAYRTPRIAEELTSAGRRGVEVRLILESGEESGGLVSVDPLRAFDEAVPDVQVYLWPLERRERNAEGRHGALHVKCAVSDGVTAFISSANLTGSAMELNMELGVLIRGGELPKRIEQHFDGLISAGVLERLYG
jgi:cardiolipin synthase